MITPLKALRKNKFKTALIFFSMVVAISAIFLISAISNGIVGMYSTMLKTDGDIIVTQRGIADTFFSDINYTIKKRIEKISNVKEVNALILGAAPVDNLPIVGIYGVSENRFDSYKLISGIYPKSNEVIMGQKIYKMLNSPKKIVISKKEFNVSGVFKSKIGFEDGGVVMRLDDGSKIFHKSTSIFLVSLKDIESKNTITDINHLNSDIEAKTTDNFIDNYNQFKIIKTSSDVISALAFLMGVLGIVSMMSMVVNDRKVEFGIMRSVGLPSKTIIIKLVAETIIIAIFAYIFALALSYIVLEIIQNTQKFQGYINGEITFSLGALIFFTSVLMAIVGTLLPAIWASRVDPMSLILRGAY
ncbi:MAG: FtsX-like permease family protein [Sulfurovaceae bacterium]|nr:FtsX-like permease family protein [Sulfurovaceae bacterium]MDD5548430.1 FtsX-like permease family protein [Sulfurovaceae bacterium]